MSTYATIVAQKNRKEKHVNQNEAWEPIHQKYKANENTTKHNPKKKQKQTINKNHVKSKDLMQRGLMATK